MTLAGHIQNGQIVLDQPAPLPEGAKVRIEVIADSGVVASSNSDRWPDGFFEKIRIDDPAFTRPDQGPMPPVASLG